MKDDTLPPSVPSENQAPTPEKPPKTPHPAIKRRQRIEEYLLTHENASNATVAAYFGISERTVSSVRATARTKGLLKPSYYDHSSEPVEAFTTEGAEVIAKELQKLRGMHNEPLTDEEMLSILAGSVRKSAAEGNIAATRDSILAYKKIETGTHVEKLGPGPPLTDEDLITRTSDILDVVGPSIAVAAISRQLPEFLTPFSEEFGRLQATQALLANAEGSSQTADSSPPLIEGSA